MNVPPITTGLSRSTASLRSRFDVTYAVPQPSLTIEMWSPATSSTSSHARGPRPVSFTCVRPTCSGRFRLKPGKDLLQLRLGLRLHVAVERVAVRVDADGERAEVLDPELPEALGHQLLPHHLFDLLDLRRLERGGAADDREVDHPQPCHGFNSFVGEAALAADPAHAVLAAERLGEAHHARARGRADADLLVRASALGVLRDLAHVRRRVEQERAAQVHRRLDALVEDADLRAVADADDVALNDDLVAGAELQDLGLVCDRERDFVRRHQRAVPTTQRGAVSPT